MTSLTSLVGHLVGRRLPLPVAHLAASAAVVPLPGLTARRGVSGTVVARQPPKKKKQTKVVGAVEDFAEGWHPHSSVKYKPLADADAMSEAVSSTEDDDDAGGEEVDAAAASAVSEQECINWTPTG